MNTKTTATLAVAVVAMMVFAAAGATTYSWFSDTESTDIEVSTATVDLGASYKYTTTVVGEGNDWTEMTYDDGNGNVSKSIGEIKNLTDNDSITVYIGEFENNASIPIDYYFKVKITARGAIDTGALTINGAEVPALAENGYVEYLIYSQFAIPVGGEPDMFDFTISTVNDVFKQGDAFQLSFTSVAYQSNALVEDRMPEALAISKDLSIDGTGKKVATVDTIDSNIDSKITVSASVPSTVDVDKFIVEPKSSADGVITLGLTMKNGDESVTAFADPVTIRVTVPYEVHSITHIKSGSVPETIPVTLVDGPQYTYEFETTSFSDFVLNKVKVKIGDAIYESLQKAVDVASDGNVITILADLEENVTVTQKSDTKFTIDGNGNALAGVITVDGKSATILTAGLTIKDINFKADSISADACIRLGDGTTATRYTCNVTVENCTFDVLGAVGIKSYTGGDKNLTIIGCTATSNAHSLAQLAGVDNVLVENCTVKSVRGLNFNQSTNVVVDGCIIDVQKYTIRFGASGTDSSCIPGIINNCTLKSLNVESDPVIELRGAEVYSPLIINNTAIVGEISIKNDADAAIVVDGKTDITNGKQLQSALNKLEDVEITLSPDTNYGTIILGEVKGVTINGNGATVIISTDADSKIEDLTLKGIHFEYTGATADCGVVVNENAEIVNLVIEDCDFVGTGAKAGRGLSGFNNNASIVIKNCVFKDLGYPIYAWGGYESLTIEGCTFNNIKSWAIMPQSGFDGDLTVTKCTFTKCIGGGLIKAGTLTAGHTFTFTDNIVTECTVAGDHNWFQFNVSAGSTVIDDNTMDGDDWTPSSKDGLK